MCGIRYCSEQSSLNSTSRELYSLQKVNGTDSCYRPSKCYSHLHVGEGSIQTNTSFPTAIDRRYRLWLKAEVAPGLVALGVWSGLGQGSGREQCQFLACFRLGPCPGSLPSRDRLRMGAPCRCAVGGPLPWGVGFAGHRHPVPGAY